MDHLFELGARPTPSRAKVLVLRITAPSAARMLRAVGPHPRRSARGGMRLVCVHVLLRRLQAICCGPCCPPGFGVAALLAATI
jgi:hypothetical protein